MEKRWNPNVEISPTCPRCGSSNTKFCYYNNYSLTQPRYFCKGCRRYWTKGGSLRNVPVGGGCRKSRRGKPFRASSIEANGRNPSRGFAGGPAALGHNATAPILSNGSLAGAEGSNIDLGLVYANFLGQKPGPEAEPEPDNQLEIPILPSAVGGPSFHQFSSVESIHLGLIDNQLSQESGFFERRSLSDRSLDAHFNDGNAFYFSGLESIEKQQATDYQLSNTTMSHEINNYMLPPLPGEELAVSEAMVWSGSDQIMFSSHALHAKQFSGGEPQVQEPNQLDENGSQFKVSIELCNIFRP